MPLQNEGGGSSMLSGGDVTNEYLKYLLSQLMYTHQSGQQPFGGTPPTGFVPAGGGGGGGGQAIGGTGPYGSSFTPPAPVTPASGPNLNTPPNASAPPGPNAPLTVFSQNPGYIKDYPAALWGGQDHVASQTPPQWIDDLIAKYKSNPTAALKDHIFSFSYPDYILKYLQDQIK